jgi:hypothetical protein
MATNFCPNCGSKLITEAKFCADCGQARAQVASTETSAEPALTLTASSAAPRSKTSNMKGLIFGSAALVAVALAVFVFVFNPFGSSSLDGKPASAIQSQLVSDGFCPEPVARSIFEEPDLLKDYDDDVMRSCIDRNLFIGFYIYTNQTPGEIQVHLDNDMELVYGKDWYILLTGTNNASIKQEFAQKYGAKVGGN